MTRSEQLLDRIKEDPYNEVSAHKVDGGIVIMLSHRITMDAAAEVFVADEDVLFFDDPGDADALEAINRGENWPGR